MSDDTVIQVEGLGKRYTLRHQSAPSNLRERLTHLLHAPARWVRRGALRSSPANEEFWALRDVNFSIRRGEVVGIIGRNGAGKSTLLKILSRITEPTTGRVRIRGRVASLLEVGTGFHPELTGRENISLNGAILGMSREEIRRKFDEIVAFAEVERFIDTPVKHYSSGMYVRLAFAVAAHLEPEILIIDEVLAVGDAAFQRKCLGKMDAVARGGRTVLFVSHNMASMQHLCTHGMLLVKGQVTQYGSIHSTVAAYLNETASSGRGRTWAYRQSSEWFKTTKAELYSDGMPTQAIAAGQPLTICLDYQCSSPARFAKGIGISLTLKSDDKKITNLWSEYEPTITLQPGTCGRIECRLGPWPFREASFTLDVYINCGPDVVEWIEGAVNFISHDGDYYHRGRLTNPGEGILFLDQRWTHHAT